MAFSTAKIRLASGCGWNRVGRAFAISWGIAARAWNPAPGDVTSSRRRYSAAAARTAAIAPADVPPMLLRRYFVASLQTVNG